MAIPAASTVAATIVASLNVPASAEATALTQWTAIVTAIFDAVKQGTVTPGTMQVTVPSTPATVPVLGTSGTLT